MAEITLDGDTAGGAISASSGVLIDGRHISVNGDPIAGHAPCPVVAIHCAPDTANGLAGITIDGIPIIRAGDSATCGHQATASSGCDAS